MDKLERIWDRIRQGRHTAVIGNLPADLPTTCGFYAVRVSCSGPPRALGPLLDARQRVEELLGGPQPLLDQATARVWTGLRRRLLGEVPEVIPGGAIVESLNRLPRKAEGRWAVCIECVDIADEDTVHLLREMLIRPQWLQVPLLLTFQKVQPQGPAGAVLSALVASEGSAGLIHLDDESSTEIPRREPLMEALRELPREVLMVLRAGALIGSGFEAHLLTGLLGIDAQLILQRLQEAADFGVLVEDNGDGRFDLPDDLAQSLRASTLPSLAISWHRRLAELFSAPDDAPPNSLSASEVAYAADRLAPGLRSGNEPAAVDLPGHGVTMSGRPTGPPPVVSLRGLYAEVLAGPTRPVAEAGHESTAPQLNTLSTGTPIVAPSTISTQQRRERSEPMFRIGEVASRERSDDGKVSPSGAPSEGSARTRGASEMGTLPVGRPTAVERLVEPTPPRKLEGLGAGNEARAASHLVAAGEVENGAARFLVAAREAAAVCAYVQAVAFAKEALSLIEGLPAAPRRRRLRVLALCELGRVQWQAVGPGGKFTLATAIESLDAARHLLEDDDPGDLRATVATLLASVCYDVGDRKSLERALGELTDASRALLADGDALGAARLLNDQAAVYVRLGDPVRSSHLLEQSRRVFESQAASDPLAAAELAETYHLLARLPLHGEARPGREADALAMARDYAAAAASAYRKLGASRELTRVWETIGHIEMKAGRIAPALRSLTTALEAQRELGDVLGLARTTAALAELLSRDGQSANALQLLGESIRLNVEKGSPIGLAYNRRSLEALGRTMSPELARQHKEVHSMLTAAETSLGRIKLPGERD